MEEILHQLTWKKELPIFWRVSFIFILCPWLQFLEPSKIIHLDLRGWLFEQNKTYSYQTVVKLMVMHLMDRIRKQITLTKTTQVQCLFNTKHEKTQVLRGSFGSHKIFWGNSLSEDLCLTARMSQES